MSTRRRSNPLPVPNLQLSEVLPMEKEAPFIRTPYNYDTDAASRATGLTCPEPTLTQQQFKDESDINILFARYLETGEMPQLRDGLAYGDFTGVFDYQSAMNQVRHANELFDQLPARIKNRFDNDPGKLLNFLQDDANREEGEFLGLLEKRATLPPPQPAAIGDTNGTTTQSGTGEIPQGRAQTATGHSGTQGGAASPEPAKST